MGTRGEIRVSGGRGRRAWVYLGSDAGGNNARRAASKVNSWLGRQMERPHNLYVAERISKAFAGQSEASRTKPFETGSRDEEIWREYAYHVHIIHREDDDGFRIVFTRTYPREE